MSQHSSVQTASTHYLCLHFPDLSLEIWGDAAQHRQALALIDQGQQPSVLRCNPRARQLGIRSGMRLASARQLCPELLVRERSPDREQQALRRLQAWAGQFSSHVAIERRHCIMLEIGSSFRMFGGPGKLRQQLDEELGHLSYACHYALGSSPTAASSLAGSGHSSWLLTQESRQQALGALPVDALRDFPDAARALQASGIQTLEQLRTQSLASVGRRWGSRFLDYLSALFGSRPGQVPLYQPAAQFESELEFSFEVSSSAMLLLALRRLLTEFSGWLRSRQLLAQALELSLCHHLQTPQRLRLRLSHPQQSGDYFFSVARLQLERQQLEAPVRSIKLEASQFIAAEQPDSDLFRRSNHARHALLDRLQARLGKNAVQGISPAADHRPEYAWRYCDPGRRYTGSTQGLRPTWLRHHPLPLESRGQRPWQNGPIQILRGPERLEAGWWSPDAISRDYYIGQVQDGSRLWIYRERGNGCWYCHGYFG